MHDLSVENILNGRPLHLPLQSRTTSLFPIHNLSRGRHRLDFSTRPSSSFFQLVFPYFHQPNPFFFLQKSNVGRLGFRIPETPRVSFCTSPPHKDWTLPVLGFVFVSMRTFSHPPSPSPLIGVRPLFSGPKTYPKTVDPLSENGSFFCPFPAFPPPP